MPQRAKRPNWRLVYGIGIVGLLVFLTLQIVPEIGRMADEPGPQQLIGRAEAEAAAVQFVEHHFGGTAEPAATVHQIQVPLYGYLSKEELSEAYKERFRENYPIETWQVEVRGGGSTTRFVHVHMQTGEVVAWNEVKRRNDGGMEPGAASLAARAFAIERGLPEEGLEVRELSDEGAVIIAVKDERIGGAQLTFRIRPVQEEDGTIRIAEYKPVFEIPEEHTRYVEQQSTIAVLLTFVGYIGLSFVMFILAIIYAVLLRRQTSFRRGILLTVLFLVFYTINNFNMIDGFRAGLGETMDTTAAAYFLIFFQMLFTIGMAAAAYFSFVGGDGLWRSMGRNLWLRAGEPGFGDDVWNGMKIGYAAAFALLGLQAVIFLALERGMGVWSSVDVSQSTLNFRWAWLFPLLAWCAAISEEAMYRLFGVGLFKKWFRFTPLAAVIPTVIWALGHVAYPIFPWSTRLIELTIIGFLFCWLMLRCGFAAALFTHAIFDLLLMAISLLFLGGAGSIAAGIFYILHPIGIAWLIRWWDRRRPQRPPAPQSIAPEPPAPEPITPAAGRTEPDPA